jgi:para-nitrobenzyl esterase
MVIAGIAITGCQIGGDRTAPVVTANQETLVGTVGVRHREIEVFKGIPFAAPPVGELRWQAPQPHRPRRGKQAASRFAAACYQDSYNTDWYRKVGAAFGADPQVFTDPPFSEDCLYLNVWAPRIGAHPAVPVLVWFHGGSNKAGWSFEANYRGENLAARGNLVVVSVAYRLGIFGFFGHPELRGSPAPANFALLDQIAALRWVQENISRFGGDPGNVTVVGESAGAANIGYLLTSPRAAGLFRRAISQSGGFQLHDDRNLAAAEQAGLALAKALPGDPDLAGLRQRSSAEVFGAAGTLSGDDPFRPVVDGQVLTEAPAAFLREHGVPYDLLIGTNEDEWYMYLDGDPAKLATTLNGMPAPAREAFAVRAAAEPDVQRGHDKVSTLSNMVCPAYLMAQGANREGHRAWVYRFTRVRTGPGGEKLLAYHGAEIPYVFDTHDDWLPTDETDKGLTTAMVAYWSNFARSGDPNGSGLASWPAFSTESPQMQELGSRIGPLAAPDLALCQQLAGNLYPGWSH